jgi:hypothetical protein
MQLLHEHSRAKCNTIQKLVKNSLFYKALSGCTWNYIQPVHHQLLLLKKQQTKTRCICNCSYYLQLAFWIYKLYEPSYDSHVQRNGQDHKTTVWSKSHATHKSVIRESFTIMLVVILILYVGATVFPPCTTGAGTHSVEWMLFVTMVFFARSCFYSWTLLFHSDICRMSECI